MEPLRPQAEPEQLEQLFTSVHVSDLGGAQGSNTMWFPSLHVEAGSAQWCGGSGETISRRPAGISSLAASCVTPCRALLSHLHINERSCITSWSPALSGAHHTVKGLGVGDLAEQEVGHSRRGEEQPSPSLAHWRSPATSHPHHSSFPE